MKRIFTLLICLVVGTMGLMGCTNQDEAFTQKNYTVPVGEITEVSIDVRDRPIEVMLSADNQIHIDYFENNKEYYDISVSDPQTLTMTATSDKEWTDYVGGKTDASSRKITVQLPDKLLTALKFSTTNEDISLPPLTIVGDIFLSSQGGNIIFDKMNVSNTIRMVTKNGDIKGSIIGSYNDFAISCDIKKGESNLPSDKKSGTKTLTVSTNNGDIAIEFIND